MIDMLLILFIASGSFTVDVKEYFGSQNIRLLVCILLSHLYWWLFYLSDDSTINCSSSCESQKTLKIQFSSRFVLFCIMLMKVTPKWSKNFSSKCEFKFAPNAVCRENFMSSDTWYDLMPKINLNNYFRDFITKYVWCSSQTPVERIFKQSLSL